MAAEPKRRRVAAEAVPADEEAAWAGDGWSAAGWSALPADAGAWAAAWSEGGWAAAAGWSAPDGAEAAAAAAGWSAAGWSADGWSAAGWSAAAGEEAAAWDATTAKADATKAKADAEADKELSWVDDILAEDAAKPKPIQVKGKCKGSDGKDGKGKGKDGKDGKGKGKNRDAGKGEGTVHSGVYVTGSLEERVTKLNDLGVWPHRRGIQAEAMRGLRAVAEGHAHKILDDLQAEVYDVWNPTRLITFRAEGLKGVPAPEANDRMAVVKRIKAMAARGVVFSPEAKSALFRAEAKGAIAALSALDDRAEMPDPSAFVMDHVSRQDKADKDDAAGEEFRADPALFKLRFIEALRIEEAKFANKGKGKKGKKGDDKGKGKGKDDGKGKGKPGAKGKG